MGEFDIRVYDVYIGIDLACFRVLYELLCCVFGSIHIIDRIYIIGRNRRQLRRSEDRRRRIKRRNQKDDFRRPPTSNSAPAGRVRGESVRRKSAPADHIFGARRSRLLLIREVHPGFMCLAYFPCLLSYFW